MAVTRLERKGRKNKNVAKNRVNTMKRLNAVPPMKSVDIEAIKEEFAKSGKKKAAPKAEKVEEKTPEAEVATKAPKAKKEEKVEAAAEGEKKAPKKKAAPKAKKEEPKEEK